MNKKIVLEIVTISTIILFLYTGISKILDFGVFREQLAVVPLFSSVYPVISWVTPASEVIVAALLFWPRWRLKGLYAALIEMALFTAYIIYLLTLDTEVPCSCGGIVEYLSWKQHLLFNIVLIGLLLIAIGIQKKLPTPHSAVSIQ